MVQSTMIFISQAPQQFVVFLKQNLQVQTGMLRSNGD